MTPKQRSIGGKQRPGGISREGNEQLPLHGQEAVANKSNELTAIPVLLARLVANNGLRGVVVSIDAIDAIATNAAIATAIKDAGADYLLAVKADQPTLRAEVGACFARAPPGAPSSITVACIGEL